MIVKACNKHGVVEGLHNATPAYSVNMMAEGYQFVTLASDSRHVVMIFFFQAEDGIRDFHVTGVQTCALPIFGGDGNDVIDGNKGADTAELGAGDDVFVWDPGDGSDAIEGQDGFDIMRFNGAPAAEQFTLSANGPRLRFLRDVGNITMDTAGIEQVDVNALGGADLVTVDDLSGTDVGRVNVDLAGSLGGTTGDGAIDEVVMTGTAGDDLI